MLYIDSRAVNVAFESKRDFFNAYYRRFDNRSKRSSNTLKTLPEQGLLSDIVSRGITIYQIQKALF